MSLEPMFAEKAKQKQGTRTDISLNSGKSLKAIDSAKEASKAVNVGHSIVEDAKFVRKHDPEAYL